VKVLYVEDNEDNVYLLKRRLGKEVTLLIAMNGEDGVQIAAAEQPDVVLMDLDLPDIDGFEATRRICTNAGTRTIPIIALSAGDNDQDRMRALAAGCADYDTKPIDLPRLRSKIEAAIARRQTPD
jgi:CheY-like chemotaxis protein